ATAGDPHHRVDQPANTRGTWVISSVGQSPTEPQVLGRRQEVAQRPSDGEARLLPPSENLGYAPGVPDRADHLTRSPRKGRGSGGSAPRPTTTTRAHQRIPEPAASKWLTRSGVRSTRVEVNRSRRAGRPPGLTSAPRAWR